ncbi:MAG: DUF1415 domain-containing protein [Saprospiraceae bacterium]
MIQESQVIRQTENWINSVVIACNFCPFASRAMIKKRVRFVVLADTTVENTLSTLQEELRFLDQNSGTETTLLIFPNSFSDFEWYLDLVDMAENLLEDNDYDGVYQVASFHPDYCFDGEETEDPANYTNRSVYPMLHLLRESSVSEAVDNYPDIDKVPERNMSFARQKGLAFMQGLRNACLATE